ncbi:CAP domain-containing protein [Tenacibaculum caenipelagi]|uniref:Cysteine-rich secretory family protein n=1 Tax=Tenacibaculum caenipelagi TaxID=1325435 RepID=A0A4R6TCS1_9FLAO|nr:CAP domain-containing protein [Tenacibaculum caenipelagi]TDQ25823.1 cysteine-rich secretory family protein [Tenacibaculum caenipelagi]
MNNYPLKLLVLFFALILTSCSSNETEIVDNTPELSTTISEKSIEADILDLINDYRVNNGFSSLSKLQVIKSQTNNHTNYMVEKNEVSHDFFYQRKEYLVENANAVSVAENVAYGYSTAESVVSAWIKSDGHKHNIEGDYTHFDITAEKSTDGKWYFTNIFVK